MVPTKEPGEAYSQLLQLLVTMVEAPKGMPISDGDWWMNDRQTLAKKLIYHLCTLHQIAAGSVITLNDFETRIVDHPSAKVVARAVMENYLTFAFLFGPADLEVSRLRAMIWRMSGLMSRQKYPVLNAESQTKADLEKARIELLKAEITVHELFLTLAPVQQRAALKGDWRMNMKWHEIAKAVNLSVSFFVSSYTYLCDYSHSSYIAALQVGEADTPEAERALTTVTLRIANYIMALFIQHYSDLFEPAMATMQNSPCLPTAIMWWKAAAELDEAYVRRDL
ncbi:MAG: hypothetical protein HYX42_21215 [Polaromonas sp.]|uniref:DUF5677 domain-containing protein n=1 Tax=Polaromonas sp. TaxID=1869339 RepID=UPI0025FCAD16|nr:DUF5677 domain-containing protein [Polaromonas sp.]MBI2728769.1 hypothetical protein [Polaromonas sp.]